MKAMILAAGFGTRLQPFTHHTPKSLVPVNGIPLILYQMAFLKHHGIREVVINLHHLGHKIQNLLQNGKRFGMHVHYSHEPRILGTGGGIKKAMRFFDKDFLVINGDVITDFDLKGLIRQHGQNNPYATISLYHHPQGGKYGLLHYQKNRIVSILKKPHKHANTKSAIYGSFHILSKRQSRPDLQNICKKSFCIMRHVYIPQLDRGKSLNAFVIKGFWHVCDSLKDVRRAEKELSQKKTRLNYRKILAEFAKKT